MDKIELDYTFTVDSSQEGSNFLAFEEIEQLRAPIEKAHNEIKNDRYTKPELSFLSLPKAYNKSFGDTVFGDTLWKAKELIDKKAFLIKGSYSDYVQIAIGGSALGAIALTNALGTNTAHKKVNVHTPDNIDPEWLYEVLNSIDLKKTFCNVISKSGGTVETLANFFIFFNEIQKNVPKNKLREHFSIMTNPEKGPLAQLCRDEGFTLIPIPDSVHGRFSILSPGGLLTAAVSGLDIDELLEGARTMDEITENLEFMQNPMLLLAAFHYIANTKKNIDSIILMPYSQKLRTISDWYSQMVAESLGKKGKGITPVKALGATDQHSQLQLYNDGPKNKIVAIFSVNEFSHHIKIPSAFPSCTEYKYLWNNSINDLFHSEERATAISLYNHGVPNFTLRIPKITPFFLGQLFMLLEKVIPILGKLYNVNAFDQEGVEESKEYARALMGKQGKKYEALRKEIKFYSNPSNLKIA